MVRITARTLSALVLLIAAFALVACGGDEDKAMSKEEYKTEAQKISDQAEGDFQAGLQNATSDDPEKSLAGINQLKGAASEAADKLDKLEPPEEFKAVHGKQLGALRTLSQRGEAVDKAAKGDDPNAISSAVESFQQSIKELDTVGTEFDKTVGTT